MDSYEPPPAQSSLRRQGISRPTSAHPRSRPTSAHPRTRSVTFAPKTNATNQQKSQTRALLSSSNAQHTSSTSSLRTRKKGRKKVRPSSSTLSRSHSQSYINNRHRPKSAVPLSKMLQSQSSGMSFSRKLLQANFIAWNDASKEQSHSHQYNNPQFYPQHYPHQHLEHNQQRPSSSSSSTSFTASTTPSRKFRPSTAPTYKNSHQGSRSQVQAQVPAQIHPQQQQQPMRSPSAGMRPMSATASRASLHTSHSQAQPRPQQHQYRSNSNFHASLPLETTQEDPQTHTEAQAQAQAQAVFIRDVDDDGLDTGRDLMTARIMQESYTDGIIFNNMNHVTGNPMSPVPVDSMHEGPENTYAMSHSASTSSLQPAPQPTPYNAHALTHDASQSSFLHPDTVELVYEREKGARNEHIKRNLKSQVREVQSKRDIDFRRLQSEIRTLHSKYLLEQNEREEKERLIQVCVKKEHTLMENIGRVKSELFLTGKKLQETQVRMREIIASSKKDFRLLSKQHSNTQQSLKESRMKRKELEQEVEQWHNKQHAHELHRSRLEHKLSEISAQHEQAKGSVKEVRSLAQNLSQKLELEKKEKGEVRQEAAEWKLKHKQLVVDKRKMHMEYETMMDQLRIDHLGCGTEILTHKKRAEVFENTIAELRKETEELVGLRELENKYNDLQQVHDKCPTASQLHAVSTKLRQFEFHDQKKKDLGVRAIDRIKNMAPQIGLVFVKGGTRDVKGIVLTDVPTDMPAYLCGLRVGDLVLQVHCKDTQNKQMFKESLKGVIAGDKIPILVKRKKKFLTVMLTVGAQGFSFKSIESYRYQAQVYDEDWRENLREEDSDDE